MKKILPALCLTVCLGLLPGCASSADTSRPDSSADVSSTTSDDSADAAVSAEKSPVEEYKEATVRDANALQSTVTSALKAIETGDVSAANSAQSLADSLYQSFSSRTAPAGYEEVQQAYLGYAYSAKAAIGYMQAATVAVSTGDSDLFDYYGNLAANELEAATADMNEATALLESM